MKKKSDIFILLALYLIVCFNLQVSANTNNNSEKRIYVLKKNDLNEAELLVTGKEYFGDVYITKGASLFCYSNSIKIHGDLYIFGSAGGSGRYSGAIIVDGTVHCLNRVIKSSYTGPHGEYTPATIVGVNHDGYYDYGYAYSSVSANHFDISDDYLTKGIPQFNDPCETDSCITNYHNWESVKKTYPSCVTDGVEEFKCNVCGKTKEDLTPARGHNVDTGITKEPTCQETGTKIKICLSCGTILETIELPKTKHKDGLWIINQPATCTMEGERIEYCGYQCNTIIATEVIPKTEHILSNWQITKQPNCETLGRRIQECTICHQVINEETIPATGHSAGEWKITKQPSCIEKGEKSQYCKICNAIIKTEEMDKSSHTLGDWNVIKNATCFEPGEKEKKCTVCKQIIQHEYIPILDHHLGEWEITIQPTESSDGEKVQKCTLCGEIINKEVIQKPTPEPTPTSEPEKIISPKLNKTKLTLAVKQTYSLKVIKKSSTDSIKNYKSSNSSIATVSKSGKITAKKQGTCYITVIMNSGKTAKCKVTVNPAKTTKITFSTKSLTIQKNKIVSLKFSRTPSYAGDKLTWISSNPKVVKVYQNGKIKGLSKGKSVITVKAASGKYARITIIVK